jgi:hypothetical protein
VSGCWAIDSVDAVDAYTLIGNKRTSAPLTAECIWRSFIRRREKRCNIPDDTSRGTVGNV